MPSSADRDELIEEIAGLASERGLYVMAAESLTSGQIAGALGAGPSASDWFAGGVVAYTPEVKQRVLGVRPGPVVTQECAEQMATGLLELSGADVSVSATGVGGPEPSEGEPPGTAYVTVATTEGPATTKRLELDGDPEAVLSQTVDAVVELLAEVLRKT
jgi:nicotinamide-nucleotide amidase